MRHHVKNTLELKSNSMSWRFEKTVRCDDDGGKRPLIELEMVLLRVELGRHWNLDVPGL